MVDKLRTDIFHAHLQSFQYKGPAQALVFNFAAQQGQTLISDFGNFSINVADSQVLQLHQPVVPMIDMPPNGLAQLGPADGRIEVVAQTAPFQHWVFIIPGAYNIVTGGGGGAPTPEVINVVVQFS